MSGVWNVGIFRCRCPVAAGNVAWGPRGGMKVVTMWAGEGGGSLEEDVVSRKGLGEWRAAPRAASWEPTERGKKGSQWKTQRRALRGKTGTREGQEKKVWVPIRRCQGPQWRIEKKCFHSKSEEALQVKSCHKCPGPLIFHNITHLCRVNFRKAGKSEASRIPGPSELWKVLASIRLCLKLSETKNKSMKKFPTLCRGELCSGITEIASHLPFPHPTRAMIQNLLCYLSQFISGSRKWHSNVIYILNISYIIYVNL